jgi:hypothetical protein
MGFYSYNIVFINNIVFNNVTFTVSSLSLNIP